MLSKIENKKKTAVVLCGITPHVVLIDELKRRGYFVVLVDYLEKPPALPKADAFERKSAFDLEEVVNVAKAYEASLVISTNQAIANTIAYKAMEILGITPPVPSAIAEIADHKTLMKCFMMRNSIPTSKYIETCDTTGRGAEGLSFPVVVKPSDSYGSRGVVKVDCQADLQNSLRNAIQASRDGMAVVEEYIDGVEYGIYFFVSAGNANLLFGNRRFVNSEGQDSLMQGYGMVYPAELSPRARSQIQHIADVIVSSLNLYSTPLMLQVKDDGAEVYVLEFAFRIGGGFSYRAVREFTGFDYTSATIDAFEGKKIDVVAGIAPGYSSTNHVYITKDSIIGKYEGIHAIEEIVDKVIINRNPGEFAQATTSSSGRVLTFLISASTYDRLLRKIQTVMESIDVIDANGESIMWKDLYIK